MCARKLHPLPVPPNDLTLIFKEKKINLIVNKRVTDQQISKGEKKTFFSPHGLTQDKMNTPCKTNTTIQNYNQLSFNSAQLE